MIIFNNNIKSVTLASKLFKIDFRLQGESKLR